MSISYKYAVLSNFLRLSRAYGNSKARIKRPKYHPVTFLALLFYACYRFRCINNIPSLYNLSLETVNWLSTIFLASQKNLTMQINKADKS